MIEINLYKPKTHGPGSLAWPAAWVFIFAETIITQGIRKIMQEILEGKKIKMKK